MLKVKEKLIFTGKVEKTSQKTGEIYYIVNFLGDDGETFGVYSRIDVPTIINQLETVDVEIKVNTGRYVGLELLSINPLK